MTPTRSLSSLVRLHLRRMVCYPLHQCLGSDRRGGHQTGRVHAILSGPRNWRSWVRVPPGLPFRKAIYFRSKMETKICPTCGPKSIENFNWRNKSKGLRCNECRDCHKAYNKRHYAANKGYYVKKAQRYQDDVHSQSRAYLETHPCIDCGENDPIVLDYDHRPNTTKKNNISSMIQKGNSWELVQKEISKCDVRCANCHRKITAKRGKWKFQ